MSTYELDIHALAAQKPDRSFLRRHQRVAPLMVRSGNRGTVIYHDMGAGKTVTAAECILEARARKPDALVLVMTKASLKDSFKEMIFSNFANKYRPLVSSYQKGEETAYDYVAWTKRRDRAADRAADRAEEFSEPEPPKPFGKKSGEFHFVTHNAGSQRLLDFIDALEDKNLDNCIVIVDEVHELINSLKNAESYDDPRFRLYEKFVSAQDCIMTFLTGTIAVNNSTEIILLYNMARGYFRKDLKPYDRVRDRSEAPATLFPYTPGDAASIREIRDYIRRSPRKFGMRIAGITSAYSPEYEIQMGTAKYGDTGFYPESEIIDEEVPMSLYQESLHKVIDAIETEKKRNAILDIRGNPMYSEEQKEKRIEELYRSFEYSHAVCNFAVPPILRPGGALHVIRQQYISDTLSSKEFDVDKYVSAALFGKDAPKFRARAKKFSFEARKAAHDFVRQGDPPRELVFAKCLDLLEESKLLTTEMLENIFSPKFALILRRIIEIRGKHAIFTSFVSYEGYAILSRLLDINGISYIIYETGDAKGLREFNDPANDDGSSIRVMFLTPRAVAGINLKSVRTMHIVENYWNGTRHQQAIARAIRLGSHDRLPVRERKVIVYKYTSVLPDAGENDTLGTDDLMRRISSEKETDIAFVSQLIRDNAIDSGMYTGRQVYPLMTGPVYRGDWSLDRQTDDLARYRVGDSRIIDLEVSDSRLDGRYVSVRSKLRTGETAILLSRMSESQFAPRMAIVNRENKDYLVRRRAKIFEDIEQVSLRESRSPDIFGQPVILVSAA